MKPKPETVDSTETFETSIEETISLYDKYNIKQQLNEAQTSITDEHREEIELIDKDTFETTDLFEKFIEKYNALLKKITESKRHNYFQFMNTFQTTNLFIIKLYDFASKLLNKSISYKSDESSFNKQLTIVSRTIELLHVLISSQNEESIDDEYSLICCAQLTKSFNFTSALCHLIHKYSIKSDCLSKSNDLKHSLLRDDKNFKMAFEVLNKLTLNNQLFSVDYYATDFIAYTMDKLIETIDKMVPLNYLQFFSNLARNNKTDVKEILTQNKIYSSFCREVSKLIKSQIGNIALNGLIIFSKICFEQDLPKSIQISTQIDIALNHLREKGQFKSFDFTKENSANFLLDFFDRDQVIKHLEQNEDYSNLIFFKLNHILIDNKSNQQNSLKVFKVLNILAKNSVKLSQRLFQIVFNTRKYLELKEDSKTQFSLIKKFQELILSTSSNETETKYDILIEYYIKSVKFTLNSSLLQDLNKTSENGAFFINNCVFHLQFTEYLLQLFKMNETPQDSKFIESKLNQLFQILVDNFKSLNRLFNSNLRTENNQLFDNNKDYLSKAYFYTLSLIDSILKITQPKQMDKSDLIKHLFQMVKLNNCDLISSIPTRLTSWSLCSDNIILSEENILISSRVLIRLLTESTLKEQIYTFFQEEYFLNLLSFAIIESDRSELTALAYEILFELNNSSNVFNFNLFIKQNEKYKIKNEKKLTSDSCGTDNLNQTFNELPLNDSKNELTDLLNIYEYKLNEKKTQEAQMISLLNQYYSNILLAESEAKILRDKLRVMSQKELESHKEKNLIQVKYNEMVKTHQIYKENNLELNKQNQKLITDKQKLTEQFEILKKEFEQMEKDNQDSIENLQNALKTEKNSKSKLESKLKETELKLIEVEKLKKSVDIKKKEVETKLLTVETQLNEKQTELVEATAKLSALDTDHEKLKSDHEKLKSILSYVKENYK